MSFKIGFFMGETNQKTNTNIGKKKEEATVGRKSMVQIYFPTRNLSLAYYNDLFDLKCGDLVYVSGKLEGLLGRVSHVSYSFKIHLSDYKRVIAVADTTVNGSFFMGNSHFISFDRRTLPYEKISTWFWAPSEEEVLVNSEDNTSFDLENLTGMDIDGSVAERGHNYYLENRVEYLCLDGIKGHAIVNGSKPYEVEFTYQNGAISHLLCSCLCSYHCKHEFAALLQLKETLALIEKHDMDSYQKTKYFMAVSKGTLFKFAIDGKEEGSFTLSSDTEPIK